MTACVTRYGSYPLRGKYCHEMALRILLSCIEVNSLSKASVLTKQILHLITFSRVMDFDGFVNCRAMQIVTNDISFLSCLFRWTSMYVFLSVYTRKYLYYFYIFFGEEEVDWVLEYWLVYKIVVYSSASAMKNTPLKLSYIYQCVGCDSFHLQPIGRTVSKV